MKNFTSTHLGSIHGKVEPNMADEELAEKKSLSNLKELSVKTYDLSNKLDMEDAVVFYKRFGFVLVSPWYTLEEKERFCRRTVTTVWNDTMRSNCLEPELQEDIPMIEDAERLQEFMGELPSWISKKMTTLLKGQWFLNFGFGAPTYASSFNNKYAWRMRQNELIIELMQNIFGVGSEMYYSLDRVFAKCPGKGEAEFIHVDKQAFSKPDERSIQGKFCAVEGSFIGVPESHKWGINMEGYKAFYKPNGDIFKLDPDKPDPLEIYAKARRIVVPAGNLIFWHPDLFHGVSTNKSKRIQFGFYLGYQMDVDRPLYKMKTGDKEENRTCEVEDRFNVYKTGVAPLLFPSCNKIQVYPWRFQNYPHILKAFTDRMDKNSDQYDFSPRKLAKEERFVTHLVEKPPVGYTPPTLGKRGREMLVGRENVKRFFGGV
jgi:hypothetical protein